MANTDGTVLWLFKLYENFHLRVINMLLKVNMKSILLFALETSI